MTREEEIKEQAEKKALEPSRLMHPYAKQHKVMSAYEIGFIEGAVWADEHPHWISVEDDLPKEDVFVQVVCDGYVSIARRHENRWQLGFGTKTADYLIYTPYNDKITHWMPMPASPHHIIDANKKVDRVIGTADHIKTALDVLNKKGGEE